MRPYTLLVITAFFIFSALGLGAQDFQGLISTGDQLYDQKDYTGSAKAYAEAFAIKDGSAGQFYNAACSAALAGETSTAFQYLENAAKLGWNNVSHIKRDRDLESLRKSEQWEQILGMIQANLDAYEKDFDKPLKARLEKIYVRDQTLRQLYQEAEEKFGADSDEMQYFWGLMAEQDSISEAEVIAIIDEYGWVGKSLVGGKANMSLWLVIQHADLALQEKYLPLMKASVLKGESSGSHLALLEDRIMMRNGKPQVYGSQITMDQETGKNVVYEVMEPEYVNQRRREVGLGPIEDYVRRFGLEWTIEQKEK